MWIIHQYSSGLTPETGEISRLQPQMSFATCHLIGDWFKIHGLDSKSIARPLKEKLAGNFGEHSVYAT